MVNRSHCLYAWNTELEIFSFMGGQTSTSKQEIQNFGMVMSRYLKPIFSVGLWGHFVNFHVKIDV